jgi:hypothetical protein
MGKLRPWRLASIIALLAIVAAIALIRSLGPTPPAWYPPCPFHALTGLYCPGCGSAHVLHDLAYGHIDEACEQNILIVVLVPFILAWVIASLWRGLRHNQPPLRIPLGVALPLLIAIIAFWILRNLPTWPFTLLAPTT